MPNSVRSTVRGVRYGAFSPTRCTVHEVVSCGERYGCQLPIFSQYGTGYGTATGPYNQALFSVKSTSRSTSLVFHYAFSAFLLCLEISAFCSVCTKVALAHSSLGSWKSFSNTFAFIPPFAQYAGTVLLGIGLRPEKTENDFQLTLARLLLDRITVCWTTAPVGNGQQ